MRSDKSDCLGNTWANLLISPIPLLALAMFFTWWLKFNFSSKCIPKCFWQVVCTTGGYGCHGGYEFNSKRVMDTVGHGSNKA